MTTTAPRLNQTTVLGSYDLESLSPSTVLGNNETHLVGSVPYQYRQATHDSDRLIKRQRAANRLPQPKPFNKHRDLRFRLQTLDNVRNAVYSTGVIAGSAQSAYGVQVADAFLNVLELETAFRACDLTPQESTAYRLSLTGLDRETVGEALRVSPRVAGNLIGRASRKLVNYVYDHPLRDPLT